MAEGCSLSVGILGVDGLMLPAQCAFGAVRLSRMVPVLAPPVPRIWGLLLKKGFECDPFLDSA